MKNFVTLFTFPVSATLLLLLVLLWLVLKTNVHHFLQRKAVIVTLLVLAIGGLYLASTPLVGRSLTVLLSQAVKVRDLEDPASADAIIVLTAGIDNAGPVGWIPRAESIHRLAVGYELQRLVNIRMPVIVSGGHTEGVQIPSEAMVTARFFAQNRTELTPTELEEVSTNTYESAMHLAPVLNHRGAETVFLVTDEVHMLRALATYRARGIDPIPFPAMSIPEKNGIELLLPSITGLAMTNRALYEIFGIIGYLITDKINWHDLTY